MLEELHQFPYKRQNAWLEIVTISKGHLWAQRTTEFFHDLNYQIMGAITGYEFYDWGYRPIVAFSMYLDDNIGRVDILDVKRNTFWNNWLKRKQIYRLTYPQITNSYARKLFLQLNNVM